MSVMIISVELTKEELQYLQNYIDPWQKIRLAQGFFIDFEVTGEVTNQHIVTRRC